MSYYILAYRRRQTEPPVVPPDFPDRPPGSDVPVFRVDRIGVKDYPDFVRDRLWRPARDDSEGEPLILRLRRLRRRKVKRKKRLLIPV